MIVIYNDEGVSTDSVNALTDYFQKTDTVKCVSALDVQKNIWINDAKLFIMPGGRSLPFYKSLGADGNKNIVDFVLRGGCYLGLCAGAYYACQKTLFAEGFPLELKLSGELNFFEGNAVGPFFLNTQFVYQSEAGACAAAIIWRDQQTYSVYFNGGCYFENVAQSNNTEILAVYTLNQQPAIIKCQIGKGHALLSGVHPELSDNTLLVKIISDLELGKR